MTWCCWGICTDRGKRAAPAFEILVTVQPGNQLSQQCPASLAFGRKNHHNIYNDEESASPRATGAAFSSAELLLWPVSGRQL